MRIKAGLRDINFRLHVSCVGMIPKRVPAAWSMMLAGLGVSSLVLFTAPQPNVFGVTLDEGLEEGLGIGLRRAFA